MRERFPTSSSARVSFHRERVSRSLESWRRSFRDAACEGCSPGRGWLIHPPSWVTRQRGIYEARRRRRSLAPLIHRIISLGPTAPGVSPTPTPDDYYAIKMWRLVRRSLNYKGLIDPIDPTECTSSPPPSERERKGIFRPMRAQSTVHDDYSTSGSSLITGTQNSRIYWGESSVLPCYLLRQRVSMCQEFRVSHILHVSIWLIRTRHESRMHTRLMIQLTRSTEFRCVDSARFDVHVKIYMHHPLYLDVYARYDTSR